MNAEIQTVDIVKNLNDEYMIELSLKLRTGGVSICFNYKRLSDLLELLEVKKLSELEGVYIQITDTRFGEEVKGIKHILEDEDTPFFLTDEWYTIKEEDYL